MLYLSIVESIMDSSWDSKRDRKYFSSTTGVMYLRNRERKTRDIEVEAEIHGSS